jgi:hypothetical protein
LAKIKDIDDIPKKIRVRRSTTRSFVTAVSVDPLLASSAAVAEAVEVELPERKYDPMSWSKVVIRDKCSKRGK